MSHLDRQAVPSAGALEVPLGEVCPSRRHLGVIFAAQDKVTLLLIRLDLAGHEQLVAFGTIVTIPGGRSRFPIPAHLAHIVVRADLIQGVLETELAVRHDICRFLDSFKLAPLLRSVRLVKCFRVIPVRCCQLVFLLL